MALSPDKEKELLNYSKNALEQVFKNARVEMTPQIKQEIDKIFVEVKNLKETTYYFEDTQKKLNTVNNSLGMNIDFNRHEESAGFVDKNIVEKIVKEKKYVTTPQEKEEFEKIAKEKLGDKPTLIVTPEVIENKQIQEQFHIKMKKYNMERGSLYREYLQDHGTQVIVTSPDEKKEFNKLLQQEIKLKGAEFVDRDKLYDDFVKSDAVGQKIYKPITVEEINQQIAQKEAELGKSSNVSFASERTVKERIKSITNKVFEVTNSKPEISQLTPEIAGIVYNAAVATFPHEASDLNKELVETLKSNVKKYDPVEKYAHEHKREIKNSISPENVAQIEPNITKIRKFVDEELSKHINEDEKSKIINILDKTAKQSTTSTNLEKISSVLDSLNELKKYSDEQVTSASKQYDDLDHRNKMVAKGGLKVISSLAKAGINAGTLNFKAANQQIKNAQEATKKTQAKIDLIQTLPKKEDYLNALSNAISLATREINISQAQINKKAPDHYKQVVERQNYTAYEKGDLNYFKKQVNIIAGIADNTFEKSISAKQNSYSVALKEQIVNKPSLSAEGVKKNPRLAGIASQQAKPRSPLAAGAAQRPRSALASSSVKASEVDAVKEKPQAEFIKVKPVQNRASEALSAGSHRSVPAAINLSDQIPPPIPVKSIQRVKSAPPPIPVKPILAKDNEQNIETAIKNNLVKLINTNYKTVDDNEKNQVQANKLSLKTIINASPNQTELLVNLQSFSGIVKGSNEVSEGIREVLKSGAQALKHASDGNNKESNTILKSMNGKTNEIIVRHGKAQSVNKAQPAEMSQTKQKKVNRLSALANEAKKLGERIRNALPSTKTAPKTEINRSKMR